jgi:mRNA interferase MazF
MKRGEVWWANLPKPVGRRPVVLLSRNAAYAVRASVTVAPVTRTVYEIPVEVRLGPEDGMPANCVINLDNILTIPKQNLDRSLTTLTPEKLALVERAIKFALELH